MLPNHLASLVVPAVALGMLICAAAPGQIAEVTTFHVATNGNDEWSGGPAAPDADGTDGPFASITRARDAIRGLKAEGELPGPVRVLIRGGVYYITETISFSPEDSGTPQSPISYEAFPREKPELVGGRRITGWQAEDDGVLSVELPEVKAGDWYFRQLFVDDVRQVRARTPNVDAEDPYHKGFFFTDRAMGGFGASVGNIHNRGDWMDYKVQIPSAGEYHVWMRYAALNEPFGTTDMGGRTVLIVDGGEPVPLMDLPDTGGWGNLQWKRSARLNLTAGEHTIRWQNTTGGGLTFDAYALCDDPAWEPEGETLADPAAGKHAIVTQAENFVAYQGKQLSIDSGGGNRFAFRYKPGEFKPEWAGAPGAEVHVFQSGSCRAFKEIVSIASVDEAERIVNITGKECAAPIGSGDRYFVENVFSELDSPGEWYLNSATGKLYYHPAEGFSDDSEVVAPAVGRILEFAGKADEPVSNIGFSGLTIRDTDYSPDDGCGGYGMGIDGAAYLGNCSGVSFDDCTFHNTGKYAVCMDGGGGNSVRHCEISDSAEGGVLVISSARNQIADNRIHHCGMIYKHIGGVVLTGEGSDDNAVSHNLVYHMSRYGITMKSAGLRNLIEYNEVRNTNIETYDTGGIEVTQQDRELQSGTLIDHNLVVDTHGWYTDGKLDVFMSWGIYLDSFAGGYTVTNNVTRGNSHGGIMLQGGKGNKIINNIFIDSKLRQMHLANFSDNSRGQVLERNIVYYDDPDTLLVAGGALNEDVIRIDNNLYFNAGGDLKVSTRGITSWEQWQENGFDQHSVIADPLFVDLAAEDYRLQPESPAFDLGFEAIDLSGIGPGERD